jgi:hypothetical protein
MKRSKIAMVFFWALLALVVHVVPGAVGPAHAQGSRKDDIVFNTRGTPLSGATIRVCAMPASGQPCTPLALIYSDSALTQALANPTTTDGLGNYFFYAAPGKYEIEISGPGITTKQIPNVILPSDPTSPAFSGGISAFSLTLSGNLTVNGNTTVVGNLASGTLNLSNQVTPPGAASSGTVNLYAKTADKRLYYKDDTGTEIGPIANTTGAQTNVVNTWTASQNFDNGWHVKGPDPYADITRFGKFGTYSSTTANTTSASPNVTLTSVQSFLNGEYVTVYNAGAANAISAMGTVTVTPASHAGGINTVTAGTGVASYNYKVVAADQSGGYTAASAAATITNGNALGMQAIGITSMTRSGTVVTVTTSAAHPFVAGSEVFIQYFGGNTDITFNGFFIVSTVADNTHFTFKSGFDTASGASTSDTGGTVIGFNCNHLTWSAVAGAWKYYIYGRSGGTYTLLGVTMMPFFDDYGSPMNDNRTFPSFIPTTAPSVGANDHLTAKINSGGGTTTLTLASNAGATLTGSGIVSDDGPAIVAAANSGAIAIYIGTTGATISSYTILPQLRKYLIGGQVIVNDTIESDGAVVIQSASSSTTPAFSWESAIQFVGAPAYPLFALRNGTHTFRNVGINCTAANGCLDIWDVNVSANFSFDNGFLQTGNGGTNDYLGMHAIFQGDGFSFRFDKMTFLTGSPGTNAQSNVGFSPIPTVVFKNTNGQLGLPTGNFAVTRSWFLLRASFDQDYVSNSGGINWWIVQDVQTQNSFLPPFMITGASNQTSNFDFENVTPADFPTAVMVNLQNLGSTQTGLWMRQVSCPQGGYPITTGNAFLNSFIFDSCNIGQNYAYTNGNIGFFSNNSVSVNGTAGAMGYQLPAPAAPTVAISGVTGPAANTYFYQLLGVDTFNGNSPISQRSPTITVNGSQGILVSFTLQPGQVATTVCRGVSGGNAACSVVGQGFQITGTSMLDSGSVFYSGSQPTISTGFSSGMASGGLETQQLNVTGGGFKNAISGTFTANRTTTLEDGSGFIPVTTEAFFSSPRSEQNVFLPGALTSTWTGSTWMIDKAVTITRLQVQAKTAPAGCTTNAVVRLTDGTTPVNVTISAAANDSGVISQSYAAGASLQILVQTAAAGCTTSPADANVTVQYRMQ